MHPVLPDDIVTFLQETGLARADACTAAPLTGGVASDIWKIQTPERVFVVKRALARLRVAQEWLAPVSRNASEVQWLIAAGSIVPDAVPAILAHDAARGVFAMRYLEPDLYPVWKTQLYAGDAAPDFAAKLGSVLSSLHAATANRADLAQQFANDDVFHSIRLEPYLEATARVHGDVAAGLMQLSARTLATKTALVHGDVSPKNILVGAASPVILDAECAWYGDPAFDLAFCLNHLLLKCLWNASARLSYERCFAALAQAYLRGVQWEPAAALEARAALLLPALCLARVDGKSPVEYLTRPQDQDFVRANSRALLLRPPSTLADVQTHWWRALANR